MRVARNTERCEIRLVRLRDLQMAMTKEILVLDEVMPLKLVSKKKSYFTSTLTQGNGFTLDVRHTLLRRA